LKHRARLALDRLRFHALHHARLRCGCQALLQSFLCDTCKALGLACFAFCQTFASLSIGQETFFWLDPCAWLGSLPCLASCLSRGKVSSVFLQWSDLCHNPMALQGFCTIGQGFDRVIYICSHGPIYITGKA
jgi:hypothetical protein